MSDLLKHYHSEVLVSRRSSVSGESNCVVSHDCTALHSEELTPILDIPPVCYGGFRRDSSYRLQMACPSANLKRSTRDEMVASVEGRISQSNPCLNTEQNVLEMFYWLL
jgi:hypothetical protein